MVHVADRAHVAVGLGTDRTSPWPWDFLVARALVRCGSHGSRHHESSRRARSRLCVRAENRRSDETSGQARSKAVAVQGDGPPSSISTMTSTAAWASSFPAQCARRERTSSNSRRARGLQGETRHPGRSDASGTRAALRVRGGYTAFARATKLSTTRLRPALSKSTTSLLPSTSATSP